MDRHPPSAAGLKRRPRRWLYCETLPQAVAQVGGRATRRILRAAETLCAGWRATAAAFGAGGSAAVRSSAIGRFRARVR